MNLAYFAHPRATRPQGPNNLAGANSIMTSQRDELQPRSNPATVESGTDPACEARANSLPTPRRFATRWRLPTGISERVMFEMVGATYSRTKGDPL